MRCKMKSLHKFHTENRDKIPQTFNTFKSWVLQIEELKKCVEIVKINTRNKFIVKDEKGILDYYSKLGA